MGCRTEKLINSYFKNEDERDKFYKEIASRDAVIRDIYFQLGFIAAVNFMRELEKRGQELNKPRKSEMWNWLPPSDEGGVEWNETEGEKEFRYIKALPFLSLSRLSAPAPSSEGAENIPPHRVEPKLSA